MGSSDRLPRRTRSQMRPGEIFLYEDTITWRGYQSCRYNVLVVIDAMHEVDFFDGTKWAMGDVAPAAEFEVLHG